MTLDLDRSWFSAEGTFTGSLHREPSLVLYIGNPHWFSAEGTLTSSLHSEPLHVLYRGNPHWFSTEGTPHWFSAEGTFIWDFYWFSALGAPLVLYKGDLYWFSAEGTLAGSMKKGHLLVLYSGNLH